MEVPPSKIDGAEAKCYVVLTADNCPTRATQHFVAGELRTDFDRLVIATYVGEPGAYLFYCDSTWQVITDTQHETIEEAKNQANIEFKNLQNRWVSLA